MTAPLGGSHLALHNDYRIPFCVPVGGGGVCERDSGQAFEARKFIS